MAVFVGGTGFSGKIFFQQLITNFDSKSAISFTVFVSGYAHILFAAILACLSAYSAQKAVTFARLLISVSKN